MQIMTSNINIFPPGKLLMEVFCFNIEQSDHQIKNMHGISRKRNQPGEVRVHSHQCHNQNSYLNAPKLGEQEVEI